MAQHHLEEVDMHQEEVAACMLEGLGDTCYK